MGSKKFLSNSSTKPHYESYSWGTHKSIFAKSIYGIVYVLRMFSFLQWFKTWSRNRKQKLAELGRDNESNNGKERKDFHALHTELYLLGVLTLAFLFYAFQVDITKILTATFPQFITPLYYLKTMFLGWLLIESILWVLYYMLLRILIERRLSIFNEAEYFIALPFVLLTQIILIAVLTETNIASVTAALFNLPVQSILSSDIALTIGILGYAYTVLIIANIINLIPAIPVWRRPNITIIGAGDVVRLRILPALREGGFYQDSQISIASESIDDGFIEELKRYGVEYFDVKKTISPKGSKIDINNAVRKAIINFVTKRASYVIIATPTDEHFSYMTALSKENIIFAVEKPIISNRAELNALEQCGERLMNRGFLLSYYWLEKALPLNYFLTLNSHFREFLEISCVDHPNEAINQTTLSYISERLGTPAQIDIDFYELEETRKWALEKQSGGFYFETFIHPMTLLFNVMKQHVDEVSLLNSEYKIDWYLTEGSYQKFPVEKELLGANFIQLIGKISTCNVNIRAGKFMSEKRRAMEIIYENGSISVDLENKSCQINWSNGGNLSSVNIKMKEEYKTNYCAQMKLFDLFIHETGLWHAQRFDDFPDQTKVLRLMLKLLKKSKEPNSFYEPKTITDEQLASVIGG